MIYKQWDVATIPFPFVDSSKSKPRPVLIISHPKFMIENGHCVACMITSSNHSKWAGDIEISNLEKAGLYKPSIIRLKLFTLDLRLNPKTIGNLSTQDQEGFQNSFRLYTF